MKTLFSYADWYVSVKFFSESWFNSYTCISRLAKNFEVGILILNIIFAHLYKGQGVVVHMTCVVVVALTPHWEKFYNKVFIMWCARCCQASYHGRVVRRCWVNFQCRGVLLIWIIVGQGPIALAVGAGGGVCTFFLSSVTSLFFLPLSGRRPDIDKNTVSKGC